MTEGGALVRAACNRAAACASACGCCWCLQASLLLFAAAAAAAGQRARRSCCRQSSPGQQCWATHARALFTAVTAPLQAAFCFASSIPLQMVSGALWPLQETAYEVNAGGGGSVSAAPTAARRQRVMHVCSSTGSKTHRVWSPLRSGHSPPATRVHPTGPAQTLTRQCQQE